MRDSPTILWRGELTTRRSLRRRGLGVLAPALFWLTIFLVLPSIATALAAFAQRGELRGQIEWSLTFDNFKRLVGFGLFGWSADHMVIFARSVWIAAVTTCLSLLLAYPLAFFIATRKPGWRYPLLALVMVPFCTNIVIRVYAWQQLLAHDMPIARLAASLRLVRPGSSLCPSTLAVYIGMVSTFLPFAVLPLYASVERLDWSIVEAARDLYASRWRIFRHAILPQTRAALQVATILAFIPAMGTFVVPDLLGGGRYMLAGSLIQQQFGGSDVPFGAAISLALMVLTLGGLFLLRRSGESGAAAAGELAQVREAAP